MKKITLLALLMWSFNFYGQSPYLDEGFETWAIGPSTLPAGWAEETAGATDIGMYPWQSTEEGTNNSGMTGHTGTKAAWFNELFDQFPFTEPAGFPVGKDRYLISPVMDLSVNANVKELTFYEAVRFTAFGLPNVNSVFYSTDYTAGNAATATWTALDQTVAGAEAELTWKIRGAFVLPNLANMVIAFQYTDSFGTEWFVDDVLIRDQPTCVEPSEAVVTSVSATTADLSWTAGPTPPVVPGSWEIELVDITAAGTPTGTATHTSGTTSLSLTSLTPGNNYEFYLRGDCTAVAGGMSAWSIPYAFSTPDANDECADSILVTHESNIVTFGGADDNPGSVTGATDSGVAVASCGGAADDDVWFTFVAGYGGVSIGVENTGTDFDPVIELFSGTCGALVSMGCMDNTGDNNDETLVDDTVVNGTTYFVRVYDWDGPGDPPPSGSFNLKVYRGSVPLQVEELEKNEFSFYPNPVQDRLNLKSPSDIENISVYNMLGQEIIRQAPNARTSEVDMSALQTGAYFVKVTINGITETKQIIKR